MKRESIYYTVIGAGILVILAVVLWQFWPQPSKPLDPPEVIAARLESSPTIEGKVRAAQDLVRHGPAAREQVYTALQRHENYEPEVVAPLVQATMKNRDHRSLPTVIDLLEDPDPLVRGRAGAAVQKILGADFGFRANAPEEERAKVVALIKQDFANSQARIHEFYEEQKQ